MHDSMNTAYVHAWFHKYSLCSCITPWIQLMYDGSHIPGNSLSWPATPHEWSRNGSPVPSRVTKRKRNSSITQRAEWGLKMLLISDSNIRVCSTWEAWSVREIWALFSISIYKSSQYKALENSISRDGHESSWSSAQWKQEAQQSGDPLFSLRR